MTLIILGLLIWTGTHLLKRLAPGLRGRIDDVVGAGPSRGVISLLLVLSIVLMVMGYRGNETGVVYALPDWSRHLALLLIWIGFLLFGLNKSRGRFGTAVRHPMITGFMFWAAAHLLVNGTVADIVLFGGLFVYGLVQIRVINAQDGPWERPTADPDVNEIKRFGISTVLFAVVAGIHGLIGPSPFG